MHNMQRTGIFHIIWKARSCSQHDKQYRTYSSYYIFVWKRMASKEHLQKVKNWQARTNIFSSYAKKYVFTQIHVIHILKPACKEKNANRNTTMFKKFISDFHCIQTNQEHSTTAIYHYILHICRHRHNDHRITIFSVPFPTLIICNSEKSKKENGGVVIIWRRRRAILSVWLTSTYAQCMNDYKQVSLTVILILLFYTVCASLAKR